MRIFQSFDIEGAWTNEKNNPAKYQLTESLQLNVKFREVVRGLIRGVLEHLWRRTFTVDVSVRQNWADDLMIVFMLPDATLLSRIHGWSGRAVESFSEIFGIAYRSPDPVCPKKEDLGKIIHYCLYSNTNSVENNNSNSTDGITKQNIVVLFVTKMNDDDQIFILYDSFPVTSKSIKALYNKLSLR